MSNESISEVLKTYQHLDTLLSDKEWMTTSSNTLNHIAFDLWKAIKTHVTKTWIPVTERYPDPEKKVLVLIDREEQKDKIYGQRRYCVTLAIWVPKFCRSEDDYWYEDGDMDYSDEKNEYFWPEGWYEWTVEGEVSYRLSDPVTHWMECPLPTNGGVE